MSRIWLCSDLHFGHDKEFLYGPRGFDSIEEHDKTIIKNWNELVSWDDEVWLLGDCMLGDNESGCRKLNQLAGNIRIITGNHDTATPIFKHSSNNFEEQIRKIQNSKRCSFLAFCRRYRFS